MKILAALPVLLLATACAHAATIEQLGMIRADPGVPCEVRLTFSSACCGINRPAYETLSGVVKASKGVKRAVEWSWGREGEKTICIAATSPKAATDLFNDLSALRFPNTNHATTTVSHGDDSTGLDSGKGG